jgi:small-conductance mechanosensitive channel
MRTVSPRLLFACALALALAERAGGQPAPPGGEAQAPEAPRAIALREIPEQLLADRTLVDTLGERPASSAALEKVKKAIDELAADVDAHRDADLQRIEELTSRRGLDTLAAVWAQRGARIGEIDRELAKEGSALARDLGQLVELRARWEATHGELAAIAEAELALAGTREMLARIDASRFKVEQRIRPIVKLEEKLSEVRDRSGRVDQAIAEARRRLRSQLFALDTPPLWSAEPGIPSGYRTTLAENLRSARDLTLDFARRGRVELPVFVLLGLAFAVFMVMMRRSAAAWTEEDPHFAAMTGILARPVSGAVLIVLMTALFSVFRTAPDLVKGATAVFLLWPMRRLLAVGILPGLQGSLYGVGAWFALDMARGLLLPSESLASRILLLAEIAGGILLIRWMRRPAQFAHIGRAGLMLRAMGQALRLAIPLLGAAFVADVAGNVSLAELIVQGILLSLYLTYFAHAALGVLTAAYGALLHTRFAQHSRIVRYHREMLAVRGERFLQLVTTGLWAVLTARAFAVEELAMDTLSGVLTASFTLGELEITLADIALFAVMIWLSVVISRVLRFVLEEDVLARARLPRGVPFAISTMVGYAVLLIGLLVAAAAAGFDIGRFTLIAGALGVGIGIGLQNVVNNFVSGLILLFERPIQLGDAVDVGPVSGTVRRIGLRSSTIRTYQGGEVVIPNSEFISNQFTNWTLSDRQRRIEVPVGVAYGSDPERVMELLLGAAKATPKVNAHPAPEVLFVGFGDSALSFEVRVWTANVDDWPAVRTALSVAINARLHEAGIEIPFPQRDLHVRSLPGAARVERDRSDEGD